MSNWIIAPLCFVIAIGFVALGNMMQTRFEWWRVWMMLPFIIGLGMMVVFIIAKRQHMGGTDPAADQDIKR